MGDGRLDRAYCGDGARAELVCPRGRDHQLEAIVGFMERAFCHECGETVRPQPDTLAERVVKSGGLVMPPRPAPINPERLRTRGFYVEEVLRREALVAWVGIRAPDGTPMPYSPDVARELLLSMPDREFVTFLRAAGMNMHALSFATARGVDDLARAMADFGVSAMQAAASFQHMAGMLSLLDALKHRDPRGQWMHREARRRAARAKYGQGRPRWINGRMRAKTRAERRKRRGSVAR